jgi:hypothetical protein
MLARPQPPDELCEPGFKVEPAMDAAAWARQMFIDEGAVFCNSDHEHLRKVDLVCMWTNVYWEDGLLPVAGYAEIVNVNGKPWARAERTDHLCLMHGNVPQARVWLYAPYWAEASDPSVCALVEHELYHYAQKKNKQGELMFDDFERPVPTQRAHDVSEFIEVVRRYGVGAVHPNVQLLIEAAAAEPLITAAQLEVACGCGARL